MFEIGLAFIAGMLSSLHCIGMCGPVVMGCITPRPIEISLSGSAAIHSSTTASITPHLLYNSGRIVSYSMIGLMAGLIGSASLIAPRLQSGFSIALGIVMIFMALFQMNIYPKIFQRRRRESVAKKIFSSVRNSRTFETKFLIGFLTPLLPCGLLYGMAAHAAASSSPVTGAIEMGVFAFGSAPALLLTGVLSGVIGVRIRKLGTIVASLLLVVMGLLIVARGLGIYHGITLFEYGEHLCGMTK